MLNMVACVQDASRHMLTVCYIEYKYMKESQISIEIKEIFYDGKVKYPVRKNTNTRNNKIHYMKWMMQVLKQSGAAQQS